MNLQDVLQAISTVGFPIVACGAMFWKVNKQDEQHKEEMKSLTAVLENNTAAIIELKETIQHK